MRRIIASFLLICLITSILCSCSGNFFHLGEHQHNYTCIRVKGTCQSKGYLLYSCSCKDSYIEEDDEYGTHSFSEMYTEDADLNIKYRKCLYCSAYDPDTVEPLETQRPPDFEPSIPL